MVKCRVLQDYSNDKGKKRKAGSTISLSEAGAKMRAHGGFVEILGTKPAAPKPVVKKKAVEVLKPEAIKKPEIIMKDCRVLITFFDGKRRTIGEKVKFTDAEANRHALAGRVRIIKPKKKKPAKPKTDKRKTATKPNAISSDKKSAGALAKPKKKPAAKPRGKKK